MDDVWGAKKHHPLGFKQHPNWKMLVCKSIVLDGEVFQAVHGRVYLEAIDFSQQKYHSPKEIPLKLSA